MCPSYLAFTGARYGGRPYFVAMGEGLVENFCRTFGQVVKGIRSRAATDRLLCSVRLIGGRMVL